MIRPLLSLGALVLLLGAWDALLAARAAQTRQETSRVGALFTAEEAEDLRKLPALRLELGGESYSFGRIEGQWRCLSLFRAPADARGVQKLIDGLVRAEGLVHARAVDEAPAYGINTPETIRVSLQGPRAMQEPGGDVRATVEIGKSLGARDECFVRRKGTKEIWAVAGDLRAALETRVAPGLPPLLAASVVPAAWLEKSGGPVVVEVRRGAAGFTLARRERQLVPVEVKPGDIPWSWVLDPGREERELAPSVSAAYLDFLERLAYVGVLDAEKRGEQGIATPAATITLRPREGPELALVFGRSDAAGRVALWVPALEALYLVEPETFSLAAPERAALLGADGTDDPWSAALRPKER